MPARRSDAGSVSAITNSAPTRAARPCARAASGQAAAEPAITLMKSRRRIAFPKAGTTLIETHYSRDLRSTEWDLGPVCIAATAKRECLLWVKSRQQRRVYQCPLVPLKADFGWRISCAQIPIAVRLPSTTFPIPACRALFLQIRRNRLLPQVECETCQSPHSSVLAGFPTSQ